ncbi:ABC transporter ATP-binding protein [Vibrio sp. MA40-2]|uniref:ABC transporter ATP-binding protein n=1 Tax=Vibrio sp. MA40-2 TaxID=3391828 RepID=UPI0039A74332
MTTQADVILQVRDLETEFLTDDGEVKVLHGVNFDVKKGKTLGLVGESGCGKSVTSMSILGLLPKPYGRVSKGQIIYRGTDLLKLPADKMYEMRGNNISIIFQDPMTALNPVQTIKVQLDEVLVLHRKELNKSERQQLSLEMLRKVRIPDAEKRLNEYPHNLSGGMRQRVMIAMALACKPDILICDEPTTALDVTVQASILDLMVELQNETGMAMIFITHDLGVVAEMCDEVAVMLDGKIVENADVFELFDNPTHAYTKKLLSLIPTVEHG